MLTLQALTYTERHSRTGRTIWNYFTGTQTPSKGSDTMLDWITLLISTVEKHAPMQVVKHRSSCPEDFIKKCLAQMFSCEFYEISKNTFFYRTPPVAASKNNQNNGKLQPPRNRNVSLSDDLWLTTNNSKRFVNGSKHISRSSHSDVHQNRCS